MTPTQYINARKLLGVSTKEYRRELAISPSTHDSYCCGRLVVSTRTVNHLKQWLLSTVRGGELTRNEVQSINDFISDLKLGELKKVKS